MIGPRFCNMFVALADRPAGGPKHVKRSWFCLPGVEGSQAGGLLQELMSSMRAGQLGHKMNDSDIHDQLV